LLSPSQGHHVSILARPFERALPFAARKVVPDPMFQSSPALSSGRYDGLQAPLVVKSTFQSSPALSSGRYILATDNFNRANEFQSSPALSSGRYSSAN